MRFRRDEFHRISIATGFDVDRARAQLSQAFNLIGVGPENPPASARAQLPAMDPTASTPKVKSCLWNLQFPRQITDEPFIWLTVFSE
jgi:hypothetical protein